MESWASTRTDTDARLYLAGQRLLPRRSFLSQQRLTKRASLAAKLELLRIGGFDRPLTIGDHNAPGWTPPGGNEAPVPGGM